MKHFPLQTCHSGQPRPQFSDQHLSGSSRISYLSPLKWGRFCFCGGSFSSFAVFPKPFTVKENFPARGQPLSTEWLLSLDGNLTCADLLTNCNHIISFYVTILQILWTQEPKKISQTPSTLVSFYSRPLWHGTSRSPSSSRRRAKCTTWRSCDLESSASTFILPSVTLSPSELSLSDLGTWLTGVAVNESLLTWCLSPLGLCPCLPHFPFLV